MADSATIEITGIEERIRKFGEASTKNPMMRKRINEVIRAMMRDVRKRLQSDAQSDHQGGDHQHFGVLQFRSGVPPVGGGEGGLIDGSAFDF